MINGHLALVAPGLLRSGLGRSTISQTEECRYDSAEVDVPRSCGPHDRDQCLALVEGLAHAQRAGPSGFVHTERLIEVLPAFVVGIAVPH